MNACIVLQILGIMAKSHLDTAEGHAKIQEAIQYQQNQCQVFEKNNPPKKEVKKD